MLFAQDGKIVKKNEKTHSPARFPSMNESFINAGLYSLPGPHTNLRGATTRTHSPPVPCIELCCWRSYAAQALRFGPSSHGRRQRLLRRNLWDCFPPSTQQEQRLLSSIEEGQVRHASAIPPGMGVG